MTLNMIDHLAHTKRIDGVVLESTPPRLPPKVVKFVESISFFPTVISELHALANDS